MKYLILMTLISCNQKAGLQRIEPVEKYETCETARARYYKSSIGNVSVYYSSSNKVITKEYFEECLRLSN